MTIHHVAASADSRASSALLRWVLQYCQNIVG